MRYSVHYDEFQDYFSIRYSVHSVDRHRLPAEAGGAGGASAANVHADSDDSSYANACATADGRTYTVGGTTAGAWGRAVQRHV
jgi:hypothetical protein